MKTRYKKNEFLEKHFNKIKQSSTKNPISDDVMKGGRKEMYKNSALTKIQLLDAVTNTPFFATITDNDLVNRNPILSFDRQEVDEDYFDEEEGEEEEEEEKTEAVVEKEKEKDKETVEEKKEEVNDNPDNLTQQQIAMLKKSNIDMSNPKLYALIKKLNPVPQTLQMITDRNKRFGDKIKVADLEKQFPDSVKPILLVGISSDEDAPIYLKPNGLYTDGYYYYDSPDPNKVETDNKKIIDQAKYANLVPESKDPDRSVIEYKSNPTKTESSALKEVPTVELKEGEKYQLSLSEKQKESLDKEGGISESNQANYAILGNLNTKPETLDTIKARNERFGKPITNDNDLLFLSENKPVLLGINLPMKSSIFNPFSTEMESERPVYVIDFNNTAWYTDSYSVFVFKKDQLTESKPDIFAKLAPDITADPKTYFVLERDLVKGALFGPVKSAFIISQKTKSATVAAASGVSTGIGSVGSLVGLKGGSRKKRVTNHSVTSKRLAKGKRKTHHKKPIKNKRTHKR